MTEPVSGWEEFQRRRWMRHDAHRWFRQDADRWLRPGFEPALPSLDRKYSEDQPRMPARNPGGGRWTRDAARVQPGTTSLLLDSDRVKLAQTEMGRLLGQVLIHASRGGGKECFYQFSYGIVALRQSAMFACSPQLPWFAATHGRLVKSF
jgi:hypothetical protein